MKTQTPSAKLAMTLAVMVPVVVANSACTADIHDNTFEGNVTIDDVNLDMEVNGQFDLDSVEPGDRIPIEVYPTNIYLVEPDQTPPPDKVALAGHLQVYLDSFDNPPLLVTAKTEFEVTIPQNTPPGHHDLKCRAHKHDGTPTTESIEIGFTITATIST